jgi:hypothetical protein
MINNRMTKLIFENLNEDFRFNDMKFTLFLLKCAIAVSTDVLCLSVTDTFELSETRIFSVSKEIFFTIFDVMTTKENEFIDCKMC